MNRAPLQTATGDVRIARFSRPAARLCTEGRGGREDELVVFGVQGDGGFVPSGIVVAERHITGERVRLFALQKTPYDMKADLVAAPFEGSAQQTLILPQFADAAKVILEPSVNGIYHFSRFFRFSRTLGDAKQSNYRFEAPPHYSERGLSLLSRLRKGEKGTDYYNKPDRYGFNRSEWKREKRVLALASPLAVWSINNPIQFSNDTSGANIHSGADDGQNKECKKIGFRTGKTGNKG